MSDDRALREDVSVLLLDLDGVLWRGEEVLSSSVAAARRAREAGVDIRCVTNNASRTPDQVAERLAGAGLPLPAADVVTSATAAADVLAQRCDADTAVLVCGADALVAAVRAVGLQVVDDARDHPSVVVTGWSDELGFDRFAEAALAVRAGAWWLATNTDATLPSDRGPLPGAGALAALVATAAGVHGPAEVAGKPGPRLHQTALAGEDPAGALGVGDRLETDVAAARAAGVRALAVLSGVATLHDLLSAAAEHRPDDVGVDLTVLDAPGPPAPLSGDARELVVGAAHARREGDEVHLSWEGGDGPAHDAARALLAVWPAGRAAPRVRLQGGGEALRSTLPGLLDLLC